jgi:hypothetical protein
MNYHLRRTFTACLCYVLALLVQPLYGNECDAAFGTLAEATVCISDDQATISSAVSADSGEHIPDGFTRLFVLTSGTNLIIEAVSAEPEFIVTTDADYRIHSLIYDPTTLNLSSVVFGQTSAALVNSLLLQGGGDICAALDITGVQFRFGGCGNSCLADAGTLSPSDDFVCFPENPLLQAEIQDAPLVPSGFLIAYVLTRTDDLIIENVSTTPEFTVQEAGDYRIHTLIFDPASLDLSTVQFGVTTGFDVNALLQQGGGDICGALDVAGAAFNVEDCDCDATFGFVFPISHDCLDGSADLTGLVLIPPTVPAGYEVLYVLTSTDELIIEAVNDTPEFTVDETGVFTIHTLVYNPATLDLSIVQFGVTTGFDVNSLLLQGGGDICGALDVTGAAFNVEACECGANAGHISASSDDCLDGSADLVATVQTPPTVPAGYEVLYVLTSTDELIIEAVNAAPEFTVQEAGDYRIHTLVYDPATLDLGIVQFGVTTGFDVNGLLQQGGGNICGALDVAGAFFHVEDCDCAAEFGLLIPLEPDCLDGGSVLLRAIFSPTVPPGFEAIYVLTSGDELIIEAVNDIPLFSVDEPGTYTIHTLIYDPATLDLSIVEFGVTTGFDINALLQQGGGDICGALDVAGAPFNVEDCNDNDCGADAGHISASSDDCLDGSADLVATVQTPPTVPAGYEVLYVLTSTDELIIEAVNTSPEFTVQEAGDYRIHTLVYDPATLDLGIVQFGVTTGFDVNGLLQQGGGNICGALDVAGAFFHVEDCGCEAAFGFIFPLSHDCLDDDDSVDLTAFVLFPPTVPAEYEVLYVLTSGFDLVIEAVNDTPEFTVDETGTYTIHTLVYDPTTLDLGIVQFGVTTGFDVNALLQQGGGDICGALDVSGATFIVQECGCDASFGFIFPLSHDCLDSNIDLTAFVLIPPTVPAGYEVLYVLTSGDELIIEAVNDTPEFTVDETGIFTIHTLVYDPATLDLSIVQFGVTTGFDVNALLQQGGGEICASLDVSGAQFDVEACECEAEAGVLETSNDPCLENGEAFIDFEELTTPVIPDNYEVLYVLTSGNDLIIEQVSTETAFTVNSTGLFTAHTLVYNPATLDLSIVEFGVTSAFTVNSLLVQGGGDICAALDVAGVAYNIETCNGLLQEGVFFPNPVNDVLQIQTPEIYVEQGMRISVFNMYGQLMKTKLVEEPQVLERINMLDLPAGTYQLVLEGIRSGYRGGRIVKF